MDKIQTAAKRCRHDSATITVCRVFGEKETLPDLVEAYIFEQPESQPLFDAAGCTHRQESQLSAAGRREEADQ